MKKTIIEKLKSRKLWVALLGVAVGIASSFGVEASEYAQIAGIITSALSVAAYVIGEASIDAAAARPRDDEEN